MKLKMSTTASVTAHGSALISPIPIRKCFSVFVAFHVPYAAFQSPRANGAHDFEVGKIPVQPYVAFHSRTEPRWLIVLSCSFLLCILLALIISVNRVFVSQRTHALHTCSCTSLTQQRINLKPTHRAYQHST